MWKHLSRIIAGMGVAGVMIYGIFLISHLKNSEDSTIITEIQVSEPSPTRKTLADRAVQRAKAWPEIHHLLEGINGLSVLS